MSRSIRIKKSAAKIDDTFKGLARGLLLKMYKYWYKLKSNVAKWRSRRTFIYAGAQYVWAVDCIS